MCAKEYDRRLGIRTTGVREWDGHRHYHRYEPTPYQALELLFESYRFRKGDRVVDFGCGRGRVTFSIHHRFHVPVVGIEAHEKTYKEAVANKIAYRRRARHIGAPVKLKFGLAEQYRVRPADNRFYFFNPFSDRVFKKVMDNVMNSVAEAPRTVDVILFYPMPEYKSVLDDLGFHVIQKVRVPQVSDPYEKFLVYRHAA